MNSRVINLLQNIEQMNRLVGEEQDVDYDTLFNVDYSVGKKYIAVRRKESIDFLKTALEQEI